MNETITTKAATSCGIEDECQYTETLAERIEAACASTAPKSKERMAALKAIRWQLANPAGLRAGMDGQANLLLLPAGHPAVQTFDGRDNESLKLAFYSRYLGPLTVELL